MYVLVTCQSHHNHIHTIVDLIKLQPTHAGTVITFLTRILCIFRPSSQLRSKGEKWTTFTTDKRHFPK